MLAHCYNFPENVKYVALDEGDKLLSPGLREECEILREAIFHNRDVCPQVSFI